MYLQRDTKQKIIRDIFISLFLYALPVILMLLSFYVTGKKPWLNKEYSKSKIIIHR